RGHRYRVPEDVSGAGFDGVSVRHEPSSGPTHVDPGSTCRTGPEGAGERARGWSCAAARGRVRAGLRASSGRARGERGQDARGGSEPGSAETEAPAVGGLRRVLTAGGMGAVMNAERQRERNGAMEIVGAQGVTERRGD